MTDERRRNKQGRVVFFFEHHLELVVSGGMALTALSVVAFQRFLRETLLSYK